MKQLVKEILIGLLLAVAFTFVTIALIESGSPNQYLFLYLGFIIISFLVFSIYGAVFMAVLSSFVSIGTLVIAENWTALISVAAYWITVFIINQFMEDVSFEYGKQIIEIEDVEKRIGALHLESREYLAASAIFNEKIQRYNKLSELSLWLGTTLNMEEIYMYVLDFCKDLFGRDTVILKSSPQDQYDRWIVHNKRPLIIEHSGKDYRFTKKKETLFQSLIECPIYQENEVAGLLRVSGEENDLESSDLRLLNVVTTLSTIALEKVRLFKITQELAIKDSLTDLYTHSYFKERLEEEVKRSARYKEKFVVMMMDLDDFKKINDKYGHPFGDKVLKDVADIMKDSLRENDIVARYGGEEISAILYNIEPDKAFEQAERIRKKIEEAAYVVENNNVKVTLTIGMASFPENPTAEELIRNADVSLYKGKNQGKNIVVM